jgi:hypothetical protein
VQSTQHAISHGKRKKVSSYYSYALSMAVDAPNAVEVFPPAAATSPSKESSQDVYVLVFWLAGVSLVIRYAINFCNRVLQNLVFHFI